MIDYRQEKMKIQLGIALNYKKKLKCGLKNEIKMTFHLALCIFFILLVSKSISSLRIHRNQLSWKCFIHFFFISFGCLRIENEYIMLVGELLIYFYKKKYA